MSAKIFGREPVVISNTIEAVLACLIAFHALNFIGISGPDTLAIVMAVVSAVLGLYVAAVTHDTLLSAVTGLIKAGLALAAVYGWDLTAEQTAGVLTAAAMVIALWQRTQTGPADVPSLNLSNSSSAVTKKASAVRPSVNKKPPTDATATTPAAPSKRAQ